MNTRSARSGKVMKRVLLIAVLMGIVCFAFPSKAFAGTQYGTTSTKSGFGYTLKSNTLINNNGSYVSGGMRVVASPSITWDAPLISSSLYAMTYNTTYERIAYRALSAAVGYGTTWSGETGQVYGYASGTQLKCDGRVLLYDSTYTRTIDYYPYAIVSSGSRGLLQGIEQSSVPIEPYSINEEGMTFGSAAFANEMGEAPDLVATRGDNGISGYVYQKDFDEVDGFATRGETVPEDRRELIVYSSDGVTILDTFTVTAG